MSINEKRLLINGICIILLFFLFIPINQSDSVEVIKITDEDVYSPTYPGNTPLIARDNNTNGTLYLAYPDNNNISVYKSTDYGEIWTLIYNYSTNITSTYNRFVNIWLNSTNDIFVSFLSTDTNSNRSILYTIYSEDEFNTTPDIVSQYNSTAMIGLSLKHFKIYTNGSGTTYGCLARLFNKTNQSLLYITKWNTSNEWELHYTLDNISKKYFDGCDISKDDTGIFHITATVNNTELWHYNSSNISQAWTKNFIINETGTATYGKEHDLEIDLLTNDLYVAVTNVSKRIDLYNSTDGGRNWSLFKTLNSIDGSSYEVDMPSMAIDQLGTLHLLYTYTGDASPFVNSIGYWRINLSDLTSSLKDQRYYHNDSSIMISPSIILDNHPQFNTSTNQNRKVLRYLYYNASDNGIYYDVLVPSMTYGQIINWSFTRTVTSSVGINVSFKYINEDRSKTWIGLYWKKGTRGDYAGGGSGCGVTLKTTTSDFYQPTAYNNVSPGTVINDTVYPDNGSGFYKDEEVWLRVWVLSDGHSIYDYCYYRLDNVSVENTIPTAGNVTVSIASPLENQDLSCNYTYNDYDNNRVNTTDTENNSEFKWYKSDIYQNISTQGLNSTNITRSESWKCEARVYDGTNWSVWMNSSSVTIGAYTSVTTTGTAGGARPRAIEITEVARYVPANLTDYCGDGYCAEDENPRNCWDDCTINFDSLVTCLWTEDVECNWEQSWFPAVLIVSLIMIMGGSIYYYDVRKKKRRIRR